MTDAEILMTDEFRAYARHRARTYLVHVKSTYLTVATIRSELASIDRELDGVDGIDYTRDRVTGSASDDGMVALLERRDSLKAELEAELMDCLQLQADAHRALRNVSEPGRSALTLHYLEGMTWTDTAANLGYSVAHVKGDVATQGLVELFPHIPRLRMPDAWAD